MLGEYRAADMASIRSSVWNLSCNQLSNCLDKMQTAYLDQVPIESYSHHALIILLLEHAPAHRRTQCS